MSVVMPNSVFYHIPKTGGIWVRNALLNSGVRTIEIDQHARPNIGVPGHKFGFCFVRNPLSWYQSRWAHHAKLDWWEDDCDLDRECKSNSFEEFVWCAVKKFPALLSQKYFDYCIDTPGKIQFIGKQENLASDLVYALRMAGEDFDVCKLLSTPKANVSSKIQKWKEKCIYTHELAQAVYESERWIFERFGYDLYDPGIQICRPKKVWVLPT